MPSRSPLTEQRPPRVRHSTPTERPRRPRPRPRKRSAHHQSTHSDPESVTLSEITSCLVRALLCMGQDIASCFTEPFIYAWLLATTSRAGPRDVPTFVFRPHVEPASGGNSFEEEEEVFAMLLNEADMVDDEMDAEEAARREPVYVWGRRGPQDDPDYRSYDFAMEIPRGRFSQNPPAFVNVQVSGLSESNMRVEVNLSLHDTSEPSSIHYHVLQHDE
ncbi:hypothetical protein EVJ58_g4810 [Rhodofomes roseus]|uniref:Uncharacterized protein n=1 Tax=Rhodofomes roseus TaxID=34475 RepID=A0A4Y9YHM5_9APHY|nr:hypothetical protein EVJ58_g4810 [Rhodofomes roseus]